MNQPLVVPLGVLRGQIDYGLITMREDEFEAVLERFPPKWLIIDSEWQYNIAELRSRLGVVYIAIVRTSEPGHSESQSVAGHLVNELDPSCLVLIGIGGAKPESEFTLGDVVAGTRLHDFGVTAALPGGRFEISVGGAPSHRLVQMALANLRASRALLGDWNSEAAIGRALPLVSFADEKFIGDKEWNEKVWRSLKRRFGSEPQRRPIVTAATFGSGNILMKDPALLQRWLEFARDLKAVEMELPGVFAAARSGRGDRPVLAIRGISDVVGFVRDPEWTDYACHTAASFALAFLTAGLLNIPLKPKMPESIARRTESSAPDPRQAVKLLPLRGLNFVRLGDKNYEKNASFEFMLGFNVLNLGHKCIMTGKAYPSASGRCRDHKML